MKNDEDIEFGKEYMINLKLPERIYYGEDDKNKKAFTQLYKDLKLKWIKYAVLDGNEVSGWFNSDKTEYIIKLQEINHYKRLSIVGCEKIVEFFKSLGAVEFELFGEEPKPRPEPEIKHFIGADLDSHYRFEEMLKNMPDNWGIKWN